MASMRAVFCLGTLALARAVVPGVPGARVRREIRSLSQEEWQSVSLALTTMKTTSQEEGEVLYGPRFMSYDSLVVKHYQTAIHPTCHQAHLGPAEHTFNRALLLMAEQSLLAVDSSIEALPYWDVSIDLATDQNLSNAIVWSEDYFGESAGDEQDRWMIRTGPFKDWRITSNASNLGIRIGNPYGLLRSPLSLNDAPRLTRHPGVCGSSSIPVPPPGLDCLDTPDFTSMYHCLDKGVNRTGGPSGYLPPWMGGNWGAADGNCHAKQSRHSLADWITGCMSCPSCEVNQTEPCTCARNETACAWAEETNTCLRSPTAPAGLRHHCYQCQTGMCDDGDMGKSGDIADVTASPNDPVFWFHFANVDRLVMAWQLRHNDSEANMSLPHSGFPEAGLCQGHNLDDVVSGSDPFNGARFGWADKNLTNADILESTVPFGTSPYIYDTMLGVDQAGGLASTTKQEGFLASTTSQDSTTAFSGAMPRAAHSLLSVFAFALCLP